MLAWLRKAESVAVEDVKAFLTGPAGQAMIAAIKAEIIGELGTFIKAAAENVLANAAKKQGGDRK